LTGGEARSDEPLRPRLAISRPGREPLYLTSRSALDLIETDPQVGREWRKWRAIGGGRGVVILLRPDLLDRFGAEAAAPDDT